MNQVIDQLAKLTFAQKLILIVALTGIVVVLYYFLFYTSLQETLVKLEKTEADLNEKLMENRAIAKNKDKFREELSILDEELKQALSLLPNDRDIRSLLRQLAVLQKKTNVTSLLFKPGSEIRKSFYSEIPMDLKLEGTYHDIAVFFDKIGKLERIVNIQDIEMSSPREEEGKIKLTVNCKATTFMFTGGAGLPTPTSTKKRG